MFQKDEKALCFHGELLYEAKVLEFRRTISGDKQSPHEYRVHYKGWKNTWDDWVPQERLRKLNDENRDLAANLRKELTQQQPPKSAVKPFHKGRRGPGSDAGSEDRHSSVPTGGRGTKRGRDNDVEKVGPKSSMAFVTLPEEVNLSTRVASGTKETLHDSGPMSATKRRILSRNTNLKISDNDTELASPMMKKAPSAHAEPLSLDLYFDSEEDNVTRQVLRKKAVQSKRSSKGRSACNDPQNDSDENYGAFVSQDIETVDDILARDPPPDEAEYISNATSRSKAEFICAPLIGGTTMDEKSNIEQELVAAGKYEFPLKYHAGYLKTKSEDSGNLSKLLFYECVNPRARLAIAGVPKSPLNLDPPGATGPFDALKFPTQLVETLNSRPLSDLYGWDAKALKRIPAQVMEQVNGDALAEMPYEVLVRLPASVHDRLPNHAPFWEDLPSNSKLRRQNRRVGSLLAQPELRSTEAAQTTRSTQLSQVDGSFETADQTLSIWMLAMGLNLMIPQLDGINEPSTPRRHQATPPNLVTDAYTSCCNSCKKLGIKCNGKRPQCFACIKFAEDCSFKDAAVIGGDLDSPRLLRSSRSSATKQSHQPQLRTRDRGGKFTRRPKTDQTDNCANPDKASIAFIASTATIDGKPHKLTPGPYDDRQNSKLSKRARKQGLKTDHMTLDLRCASSSSTFTYDFTEQEDNFHARPSIKITLPDHLKNLLVDDWENVTKSLLLVPLPSKQPANLIIDTYFEEEKAHRRLGSAEADILEEFCAGLKVYFEKSVGKILLYRFERGQLADVRRLWESGKYSDWEGKGPGDAYGAEHLTRMLVNMPEMIAQTNMDAQSVSRLKEEISKFCTWLSRNSSRFFCAKYEKPTAEYIEGAR